MKQPCVYVLASDRNGTQYIGVTSDPILRIHQHRNDLAEGFSKKYQVHRLVYFEMHDSMESAITREKQLKKWNRAWKLELIEKSNPTWRIYGTKSLHRPSFPRKRESRPDLQLHLLWIPAFAGMTIPRNSQ